MKKLTKHWLFLAESDFDSAVYLYKGARYPQAIYFLCQAIEKILKSSLVQTTNKKPPHIHSLHTLSVKSLLNFSINQHSFLKNLNKDYSRVRYSDLAQISYNTKKKTQPIFIKGKKIYLWIKKKSNKL